MGNKLEKKRKNPLEFSSETKELTQTDLEFLATQTGFTFEEINNIFQKFNRTIRDQKLDRDAFSRLYSELRPEPNEYLDEISFFIFKAFDTDKNGYF